MLNLQDTLAYLDWVFSSVLLKTLFIGFHTNCVVWHVHAHYRARAHLLMSRPQIAKWLPAAQLRVVSFCLFSLLDPRLKWRIFVIGCVRGKLSVCVYGDALASTLHSRMSASVCMCLMTFPLFPGKRCFSSYMLGRHV